MRTGPAADVNDFKNIRGYATLAKSIKSTKMTIHFFHLFHDFSFWYNWSCDYGSQSAVKEIGRGWEWTGEIGEKRMQMGSKVQSVVL